MSVGPLSGLAGSVVGSPLAQIKGSDVERTRQDAGAHEHRVQGQQKAESASGIGETDGQDHETAERDADGRRPWEKPARSGGAPAQSEPDGNLQRGKDPTGQSGNLLDLTG